MKRICLVPLLVVALLASVFAGRAAAWTSQTDVVFVHGYNVCDAANNGMTGPLYMQYWSGTPMSMLHTIKYYDCEPGGESIIDSGPEIDAYRSYFQQTPGNGTNQSFQVLAYELAWYLYDNFTAQGKSVDLVGASMGGLIVAVALREVAAHDPWYPPSLVVPSVVTFATPFAGGALAGCYSLECMQFAPGSRFIQWLDSAPVPQGANGTRWTEEGTADSCGTDFVSGESATGLAGAHVTVVYSYPCYSHLAYAWDFTTKRDAIATINGSYLTQRLHSLYMMSWALV